MARQMHRYVVPVDDRAHSFELTSSPRYTAAALAGSEALHVVEFWAEHTFDAPTVTRFFQVYGTGHKLPDGAEWVGTCDRTPDGLVWHLYENPGLKVDPGSADISSP